MEQTKVEAALKRLWKEYIKVKIELAAVTQYATWDSKEEFRLRLDKIKKTEEIVEYIEKEGGVK